MLKRSLSVFLLMTMLLVGVVGCSGGQESNGDHVIQIATKPMTEQFILSEMLALLIEANTNLDVEITKGIGGGTANIHPALVEGEFDLYPEYTGSGWSYVLHKEEIPDDDTLYTELNKAYQEEFGLQWVGQYGFNNTFGVAVHKDVAEEFGIETYSDLAAVADQLVFGAEPDFYERDDGYDGLCAAYGMTFKEHTSIDIGLKYQAINEREIDVMNIFTTDGQLSVADVVMLEDDLQFYQTYYCGTVVRMDILEQHPELMDVLLMMEGIINEEEMARLNYEVEGDGKLEEEVAESFLKEKGLLK